MAGRSNLASRDKRDRNCQELELRNRPLKHWALRTSLTDSPFPSWRPAFHFGQVCHCYALSFTKAIASSFVQVRLCNHFAKTSRGRHHGSKLLMSRQEVFKWLLCPCRGAVYAKPCEVKCNFENIEDFLCLRGQQYPHPNSRQMIWSTMKMLPTIQHAHLTMASTVFRTQRWLFKAPSSNFRKHLYSSTTASNSSWLCLSMLTDFRAEQLFESRVLLNSWPLVSV